MYKEVTTIILLAIVAMLLISGINFGGLFEMKETKPILKVEKSFMKNGCNITIIGIVSNDGDLSAKNTVIRVSFLNFTQNVVVGEVLPKGVNQAQIKINDCRYENLTQEDVSISLVHYE
ncbi:MAG: hypothetical protein QW735_00210 [archaeon]